MKFLAINPGSTSAKYSLFENDKLIAEGKFRKKKNTYTFNNKKITEKQYNQSFSFFTDYLIKEKHINEVKEIKKIGIRIVHGGSSFTEPTLINDKTLKELKEISVLAPLHNPPAINIIELIRNYSTDIKIYGVFDTAFHQTISEFASKYAIPHELSKKHHIQRYGFHGIACQSVHHQVRKCLGYTPKKMIICHLGGGASITATENGKSKDTTMGLTPLEGLMMISRSGDIDPGIINHLEKNANLTSGEILEILNKKSGIRGITGTDDMLMVVKKARAGDQTCKLAVEMFVYRIVKYIFAYYGALQGLDVLTFSGGIGRGNSFLRKIICEELRMIGIRIEDRLNKEIDQSCQMITPEKAEKKVFVMKVEENEEIAREIEKL